MESHTITSLSVSCLCLFLKEYFQVLEDEGKLDKQHMKQWKRFQIFLDVQSKVADQLISSTPDDYVIIMDELTDARLNDIFGESLFDMNLKYLERFEGDPDVNENDLLESAEFSKVLYQETKSTLDFFKGKKCGLMYVTMDYQENTIQVMYKQE